LNKNSCDIIIIGAGPSGCIAAREIKKYNKKISVLILEEHSNIGEPMQCAGLISIDGFKKLGINPPKECILNIIYGARFYSPSNKSFSIKVDKPMAYVIDRRIFDKYLAEQAIKSGVKLKLGHKVSKIIVPHENEYVKIHGTKNNEKFEISSKIVLDAEGIKGNILRQCGFQPPSKIIPAIQIEMENIKINDKEIVELYFGRNISPGFFAYLIPTSKNSARIEAASNNGNPYNYLVKFLKTHRGINERIKNANIVEVIGGGIITSGPVKKTHSNNMMLIGDSAGHVKATTGGGVIMGGLCSKIAAKIAAQSILQDNFSSKMMHQYEKLWRKKYGNEFFTMNMVRTLIDSIPDPIIDELFDTIDKYKITKIIESYGDMDFQSEVIKRVIFSKKMPLLLVSLIFGLFKHIF